VAQNRQLCLEANVVSRFGAGGTSDNTSLLELNDGHGTADDEGSPPRAKAAQARRMLAPSDF
jgi:hypothetical protein